METEYFDDRVCFFWLCFRQHLSGTTCLIFTKYFCILLARPICPWLGPPVAALRYVMYFRLYGWRHDCTRHQSGIGDALLAQQVVAWIYHRGVYSNWPTRGQHRTGSCGVWYLPQRPCFHLRLLWQRSWMTWVPIRRFRPTFAYRVTKISQAGLYISGSSNFISLSVSGYHATMQELLPNNPT